MRKIFCAFAILSMTLFFSACTDDDESGNEQKAIIDPFDWNFQFNDEGILIRTPCTFDSTDELLNTLVGYGWKHIVSYKITDEGIPETENYYTNMIGISPSHYYFENEYNMYEFLYSDANAGQLMKINHNWTYIEKETLIVIDSVYYDAIQIIGKSDNQIWLTHCIGCNIVEGKSKPIYTISRYDKMTDKELNDFISKTKNFD